MLGGAFIQVPFPVHNKAYTNNEGGETYNMTLEEKILTSEKAMQIAKEFIQKHRVSSQAPVSDPPAYPDKP